MFRLLSRYVFREILTSSLLGSALATFVFFLREVNRLFEVIVGSGNADARTILTLMALSIPPVLPLTIPFGVLVGILIGLGRMAADGEIIAMRAAGVSSRRVIFPVLVFATFGCALAALASLRLTPYSYRRTGELVYDLAKTQLSADIKPRSFIEDFPNTIVYVSDVVARPGFPVRWKNVFIADVTPPNERKKGIGAKADGPMVTVAREAIAVSDPLNNRIQLRLEDRAVHEMGKDGKAHDSQAPVWDQALDARPPEQRSLASRAMNTRQLWKEYYGRPDWVDIQQEFHRRLAFPVACIALALVGIPLGIATRKGGKSAGYVNALFVAFFGYYLSSVTLLNLAKQQTPFRILGIRFRAMPVPLAVWLPDIAFFVAGVIFLYRMERPGDRDPLGHLTEWFASLASKLKARFGPQSGDRPARLPGRRLPLLPQIIDTYVMSSFLFYLFVVLASFVSMILVFNFFELSGDMFKNNIPLRKMMAYLFFLSPQEIYNTLPLAVLVAVLICLGVLSKQNEVTAFRACGVSLYRLAAPILVGSVLLSGSLFAFNYSYVPGANKRQDKLRDEIKNRTGKQTYLCPNCKWVLGYEGHIYYYKYFDTANKVMGDVSVFELDPHSFRLMRQIQASRAGWSSSLKTWVFENGWSSDFRGAERLPWARFETSTYHELREAPEYFLTEAVPYQQMNFQELDRYIGDLQQRGFDTVKLQVQFYLKFAAPLFALIMAMIAVPFGFKVGNRGRMTGIGVSLAIAVIYSGIGTLFEKIGDVNSLPPAMAAWSPDVVFSLAGLYLLSRMKS